MQNPEIIKKTITAAGPLNKQSKPAAIDLPVIVVRSMKL